MKAILLYVYFLFLPDVYGQKCEQLPQSFVSISQAVQMVERADFRFVDQIDSNRSSWIKSAIYFSCDRKKGFFLLKTKTGKEYLFQDMPFDMWLKFKKADSQGQYYNQYIRNKYQLKIKKI